MRRSLLELLEPSFPSAEVEPSVELSVERSIESVGAGSAAVLSVLLFHLRYLALLHQTHHWIARGDQFYGDHHLFEELYAGVQEEIDSVAERAVGLAGDLAVNLQHQMLHVIELMGQAGEASTVPSASELAQRSLQAEQRFLTVLEMLHRSEPFQMSLGTDNLVAGIADLHEKHVYLLQRRCSSAAFGL